jgi:pimeloyl-ACP methyl ester carboxylesterase
MVAGFQAGELPAGTLQSTSRVEVVETADGWAFEPKQPAAGAGLLFLPGGMVEPEAYAPLLKRVAEAGYPARLIRLPMRCACTNAQKSALNEHLLAVLSAKTSKKWLLGGHSRGAMLAAAFAQEHPQALAGLALIGTTHPRDFDLSALSIPVLKVLGSNDGIASPRAVLANRHLLPPQTVWREIDGANHVQFGYYRHQLGDHAAQIPRAQQQAETLQALLELLNRVRP